MRRDLFRFDAPASVADWSAIDDRVMGGLSSSRLRHDPAGHAVFEGVVTLEQGGGFASVRTRPLPLGAPGALAYLLEIKGDGRRYMLNLRTDDGFDGPNQRLAFDTVADAWTTLRLPVAAFRPSLRGRELPGAPALDPGRVRQIGLMIAGRQAGPFALALRSIAVE
jgi:NADH dehydrogenase [ubiquinone] 1 alpha subcomplex assembly factor 1